MSLDSDFYNVVCIQVEPVVLIRFVLSRALGSEIYPPIGSRGGAPLRARAWATVTDARGRAGKCPRAYVFSVVNFDLFISPVIAEEIGEHLTEATVNILLAPGMPPHRICAGMFELH
jgi:hypothetical protein